jgi:hypothetical protein
MNRIRYSLLSDGSSDKMLLPVLDWLLHHHCPNYALESILADLGRLPKALKMLPDRIRITLEQYEPNLLFIHRDAEKQSFEFRHREINKALSSVACPPAVCVIPVRMQEAWLLFDKEAIRRAASNPNGRIPLQLPAMAAIEAHPNPKEALYTLIRDASELTSTRLKKLRPQQCAHRVAQSIADFAPLRTLSAFRALEAELRKVVNSMGWNT